MKLYVFQNIVKIFTSSLIFFFHLLKKCVWKGSSRKIVWNPFHYQVIVHISFFKDLKSQNYNFFGMCKEYFTNWITNLLHVKDTVQQNIFLNLQDSIHKSKDILLFCDSKGFKLRKIEVHSLSMPRSSEACKTYKYARP